MMEGMEGELNDEGREGAAGEVVEVLEVWRFLVLDAALKQCLLTLRPATRSSQREESTVS